MNWINWSADNIYPFSWTLVSFLRWLSGNLKVLAELEAVRQPCASDNNSRWKLSINLGNLFAAKNNINQIICVLSYRNFLWSI